jgi:hypothetical protein
MRARPTYTTNPRPESGPHADDVLCVFDEDASEPGAVFALVLNQPLDRPAQPLAFALFDTEDACAWWGGPTHEAFAIVELPRRTRDDQSANRALLMTSECLSCKSPRA